MTESIGGPQLSVASFNVHCGVDGWGRPFDVVGACANLDADIIVIQESWSPDDGMPSTASNAASQLGYACREEVMAHGRLYGPDPMADGRWGPPRKYRHAHDTLRLNDQPRGRAVAERQVRPFGTGAFSVAVLTRVPFSEVRILPLGKLRHDPCRRLVIAGTVQIGGKSVTILGTHMSHVLQRSPVQYLRLRAAVPPPTHPAVLVGDMNLWGPPVTAFLGQWRRAIRGRTWPSARPHSQLDHIVVTPAIRVIDSRIASASGSDHRPVRVVIDVR